MIEDGKKTEVSEAIKNAMLYHLNRYKETYNNCFSMIEMCYSHDSHMLSFRLSFNNRIMDFHEIPENLVISYDSFSGVFLAWLRDLNRPKAGVEVLDVQGIANADYAVALSAVNHGNLSIADMECLKGRCIEAIKRKQRRRKN